MDRATLVGLVGAFGLSMYTMYAAVAVPPGESVTTWVFLQPQSLLLVFLGSICCAMICTPWQQFVDGLKVGSKCFFYHEAQIEEIVPKLVGYAIVARRDGNVALDRALTELEDEDPFLVKGLRLVVSGMPTEEAEMELRSEMFGTSVRHKRGRQLYILMGKYAPAFGLLTTIIGEVVMFDSLKSGTVQISRISAGMAVALLGTMYGIMLANFVFLPFADKLQTRSDQELFVKELYTQTVKSVAREENPQLLRETLLAFLDRRTIRRVEEVSE